MRGLSRDVEVGEWYRLPGEQPFEVVAVDADHETIEVQHFDGTVQEFDFDTWAELGARPAAPPEDWSGALDLQRDDYGVDIENLNLDGHSNPLDQIL